MQTKKFSRREFLRLSALPAAGAALAGCCPPAEEPAEQAVQKAILSTETEGNEFAQVQQQDSPPIPITELPSKDKATVTPDTHAQSPIPIVELPPDGQSTASSQEPQDQQIHSARDHEPQTAR